jgi:hypothetical protein
LKVCFTSSVTTPVVVEFKNHMMQDSFTAYMEHLRGGLAVGKLSSSRVATLHLPSRMAKVKRPRKYTAAQGRA